MLTFVTFKLFGPAGMVHDTKASHEVSIVVERITHMESFMVGTMMGTNITLDNGKIIQVDGLPSQCRTAILSALERSNASVVHNMGAQGRRAWDRSLSGAIRSTDPQPADIPLDLKIAPRPIKDG